MNKIIILLSTYNGEKYLNQQLDSIFSQTYKNFEIIARDDGSQDKTVKILHSYNITIIDSKNNLGAKDSFEFLLDYAIQNSNSDYFMFCDQDDIWLPNKIESSLAEIKELEKVYGKEFPLLVFTDMKVVDKDLKVENDSFWKHQKLNPNISNDWQKLLAQNVITGCTMIFNRASAQISLPFSLHDMLHDHWIGVNVSKYGKVVHLDIPTVLYRQHGNNVEGAHRYGWVYVAHKLNNLGLPIKKLYRYANYFEVSFVKLLFYKLIINLKRLFGVS